MSGTLTVTNISLWISAQNKSTLFPYTSLFRSETITGAVNGDTFTVPMSSTGAGAAAGFGTYPIAIGTVTGSKLANYNLTANAGMLTVAKIALSITADDKSKNYGVSFTGFTETITGAVNGYTFTVPMSSTGAGAAAGVGTYPTAIGTVTCTNLANYNLTANAGTLTVAKIALSITADDKSKNYGVRSEERRVGKEGAVQGDTFRVTMSSTGAGAADGVGTYPSAIGTVTGP